MSDNLTQDEPRTRAAVDTAILSGDTDADSDTDSYPDRDTDRDTDSYPDRDADSDRSTGTSSPATSAEAPTSASASGVQDDEPEIQGSGPGDEVGAVGSEGAEGALGAEEAGSHTAPGNRRLHLEREGEVAADFLETLLDICDLDGDIDVDIDGDRAVVSVVDSEDGRVPRRLVGPNGQVLDALQELTRLAVQSATGERSRLMLDVAGHRAERRAALVALATEAIDEVRTTGERKPLTPMTAFERKVVHDEVLAAGLVSESEGAEPRRFVVILPS